METWRLRTKKDFNTLDAADQMHIMESLHTTAKEDNYIRIQLWNDGKAVFLDDIFVMSPDAYANYLVSGGSWTYVKAETLLRDLK